MMNNPKVIIWLLKKQNITSKKNWGNDPIPKLTRSERLSSLFDRVTFPYLIQRGLMLIWLYWFWCWWHIFHQHLCKTGSSRTSKRSTHWEHPASPTGSENRRTTILFNQTLHVFGGVLRSLGTMKNYKLIFIGKTKRSYFLKIIQSICNMKKTKRQIKPGCPEETQTHFHM